MAVLGYTLIGLAKALEFLLTLYQWILIAAAVVSWVSADPRNPIVALLHAATDPPKRWIRRYLPASLRYFPLDVAFLVLFALVLFALYGIVPMIGHYGASLVPRPTGGFVM